jgi:hypothetical protein
MALHRQLPGVTVAGSKGSGSPLDGPPFAINGAAGSGAGIDN